MSQNENLFRPISEEERKEIEESLYTATVEQLRCEMIEENYYKYNVKLQNIEFWTAMTDEELRESIKLVVDILEELKLINSNGMTREVLTKLEEEASVKYDGNDDKQLMITLQMSKNLESENLSKIVCELDRVRRVGGAWAVFIANPGLRSAIYAVYDRLVDHFDNDNLYQQSSFFLLRAVMHMHSHEQKSENND